MIYTVLMTQHGRLYRSLIKTDSCYCTTLNFYLKMIINPVVCFCFVLVFLALRCSVVIDVYLCFTVGPRQL